MAINRLLKWHNRLPTGTLFDRRIEVFDSVGGFGIRAIRNILEPSTIIRVPAAGWREFSADEGVNEAKRCNPQFYQRVCDVSKALIPNSVEHMDNLIRSSCMATKLIIDKQEKLPSPYVSFLKETALSSLPHPLLMADDLSDPNGFLIGSNSRREILRRREMYTHVAEALFGRGHDMVHEFKWAMGIILSRAVSNTATGMPLTLVPILDLVNHGNEGSNAAHNFDKKMGVFSLNTTTVVFAGEEICINYGEGRDTASFMSLYGFYGKGNQNDNLRFHLLPKLNQNNVSSFSKESSVTDNKNEESSSSDPVTEIHDVAVTNSSTTAVQPIKIFGEISLDFLHSLDKDESHNIIKRLLQRDSESVADTENRLQLCGEVVAAAHGALGENLLQRARVIAATQVSVIDLVDSAKNDVVDNEILSIIIVLESVDRNILDMLPVTKDRPPTPKFTPSSSSVNHSLCVPPLVATAEKRLQCLLESAALAHQQIMSPSTLDIIVGASILQWRYSCAAVSARELDGLIRLRLFCTAYHIALLSSV